MEKIDKFNIRVYGLLIHNQNVLVIKEPYAGEILYKFPGGGLEFGEGLVRGLCREFMEELNVKVSWYKHFYTQEDFVQSKFRKNEQLLTVYYLVKVDELNSLEKKDLAIEDILWCPINLKTQGLLTLPIDKKVMEILCETNAKNLIIDTLRSTE